MHRGLRTASQRRAPPLPARELQIDTAVGAEVGSEREHFLPLVATPSYRLDALVLGGRDDDCNRTPSVFDDLRSVVRLLHEPGQPGARSRRGAASPTMSK
jgi:hypothetical protein